MQKIDNPKFESKVLQLLGDTSMPVSVDFVAYNLGINWTTSRGLLLNMALKGQIKATKTTKSLIFSLPERRSQEAPQK